MGLSKIKLGLQKMSISRKFEFKRDWGHAKDYVEAQWLILQQNKPEDFVIASGVQHSVKDFVNEVAKVLDLNIYWKGSGIDMFGYNDDNECIIRVDKNYFRPTIVDSLLGTLLKRRKTSDGNKIQFLSTRERNDYPRL